MTTLRTRALACSALGVTAALLLAACGGSSSTGSTGTAASDRAVSVVAAFYPLEYAARAVGGDAVDVVSLTPPGVEPHDLELSAQQVAQIAEADLVLYVPGFQPAVDEAVQQQAADRAVDVTAGLTLLAGEEHADDTHDHGAGDPHVWLDPANMAVIGTAISDRLAGLSPTAADAIGTRASDFATRMTDLDAEFTAGLADCAVRDLVVSHEAFGYLADAYGFTQVGISGLSPEAEPSPARLKEVADLVSANGVSTIYYETLVDPKVAQTVADETGAATAVLDPLEGLAPDASGDYLSVMRTNLATLQAGQSCT